MLKTFILVWIIEDLLAIPYSLFFALLWRPRELDYYWDVSNMVSISLRNKAVLGRLFLVAQKCQDAI